MSKKNEAQKLQEELTWSAPHIAKEAPEQKEKAFKYCEGYKEFLNKGKTERECVKEAVKMLKKAGYKPFDRKASYVPGDKVYVVNREKAVIATTFGKKPLKDGLRINGAHIDAPRLDLKPNPLYEKEDIAYFKTHYYGGIRKYQWGTVPLAIHGVVAKKNGELIEVCIGEKEDEPAFCITDLLPHLAGKQNERPLREGLKGEELNVIIGSIPYEGEEIKEAVKLMVLSLLHEKYGIKEKTSSAQSLNWFLPQRQEISDWTEALWAPMDRMTGYAAMPLSGLCWICRRRRSGPPCVCWQTRRRLAPTASPA